LIFIPCRAKFPRVIGIKKNKTGGGKEIMHGKILAVDDEPDQLALLDAILKEEGFTIDTAANGIEALDKVNRCRPDVILVDVAMPKMNGFTLCAKLRGNPATAAIPVLMLTGLHRQFDRLNGFAHGANAYLTKPYAADELISALKQMLTDPTAGLQAAL
jgi:CheY-like chemotaxis protein